MVFRWNKTELWVIQQWQQLKIDLQKEAIHGLILPYMLTIFVASKNERSKSLLAKSKLTDDVGV